MDESFSTFRRAGPFSLYLDRLEDPVKFSRRSSNPTNRIRVQLSQKKHIQPVIFIKSIFYYLFTKNYNFSNFTFFTFLGGKISSTILKMDPVKKINVDIISFKKKRNPGSENACVSNWIRILCPGFGREKFCLNDSILYNERSH